MMAGFERGEENDISVISTWRLMVCFYLKWCGFATLLPLERARSPGGGEISEGLFAGNHLLQRV
jgi:hypothetical protein